MEVALAAGALVLSAIAVAVAGWSGRARKPTAPPAISSPGPIEPTSAVPPSPTADADPSVQQPGSSAAPATPPSPPRLSAPGRSAGDPAIRLAAADLLARSRSAGDAARAVERSLAGFVPGAAVEVRLAPLRPHRSAAEEPPTEANSAPHVCPVPTVDECPAVRQATAITCEDSRRIDACHWLSDRPGRPLEAACVPVAVAGRGIGFLHVAAPLESDGGVVRIDPAAVDGVAWLAMHLGARLDPASDLVVGEGTVTPRSPTAGFSTPTGAVTLGDAPVPGDAVSLSPERDTGPFVDLTDAIGEAQVGPQPQPQDSPPSWSSPAAFLRTLDSFARRGDHYVLVLGGVDDISGLAADVGYAAAEAAVAVLAVALSADPDPLGPASVLACSRLDESTIAVAWTGLSLGRTVEVLEVVRGELVDSVREGVTEPCRRSFGLTHSSVSGDPEQILAAARAGLRRARALGGDQIVYADLTLLDEPPQ